MTEITPELAKAILEDNQEYWENEGRYESEVVTSVEHNGIKYDISTVHTFYTTNGDDREDNFVLKINNQHFLWNVWYTSYDSGSDDEIEFVGEVEYKTITKEFWCHKGTDNTID